MKNSLLRYGFVLSLLLNVSLLGAAGYNYYQQTRHRANLFGCANPGRAPAPSAAVHTHLFEALSLTPEQQKVFEQKASMFHEALHQKGEQVDRLRGSLLDLIRGDDHDDKAIQATIAEISAVQKDMQNRVVDHMLEFKSMLDKDQQKKFFDLVQAAMNQRQEVQCP